MGDKMRVAEEPKIIEQKPKTSGGQLKIDNAPMDPSDYDDDEFDIHESLPKDGMDDIFNQNKNFSGGLAALTGGKDKKPTDKKINEDSKSNSGLGVDDNYD